MELKQDVPVNKESRKIMAGLEKPKARQALVLNHPGGESDDAYRLVHASSQGQT